MEPLIAVGFAFFLFTRSFFAKPPEAPSEERQLADALVRYLERGINVRNVD